VPDVNNAEDWADADVLIAPIGSTLPATENDPFNSDWKSVGYIDGETGLTNPREQTYTDTSAWGAGRIKRTSKNYMESVSWKSWEYNEVTRALLFPGSAAGVRKVPKSVPVLLALDKVNGETGEVRRLITSSHVIIDPATALDEKEGETNGFLFVANVIPNPDKELWIEQPAFGAKTLVSVALTGTTTTSIGGVTQFVATATYSDATTADVTAGALWSSATPAKATVPYGAGAVHGVAAGTSVITARYGSVSNTRTVTVS
jgi:hypothetical protein